MSTLETLKRCEIFVGLEDDELHEIARLPSCQYREFQPDDTIFEAGDEAMFFYILEEGKVSLALKFYSTLPSDGKIVFRTITRGGIFGWSALVPPHIRVSSAISKVQSRILEISGEELRTLFDRDSRIGYEVTKSLVRIISSRVWNLEQLLVEGRASPFVS